MSYKFKVFLIILFFSALFSNDVHSTAPIRLIGGPATSEITFDSATVYIELDRPATCSIELWSDNRNKAKRISLGQKRLINYHLKSLSPNTNYSFALKCAGNILPPAIGDVFTTDFLFKDKQLTFVKTPKVTLVTPNSAIIEWTSSRETGGRLQYGEGGLTNSIDLAPVEQQVVELELLNPGKKYLYQVELVSQNKSLKSKIGNFRTKSGPKNLKALFSLEPTVVNLTPTEAVIQFETTVPTKSILTYGIKKPLKLKINSTIFQSNHTIRLKNLKPATNYFYNVKIITKKGETTTTDDFPFVTEITD